MEEILAKIETYGGSLLKEWLTRQGKKKAAKRKNWHFKLAMQEFKVGRKNNDVCNRSVGKTRAKK